MAKEGIEIKIRGPQTVQTIQSVANFFIASEQHRIEQVERAVGLAATLVPLVVAKFTQPQQQPEAKSEPQPETTSEPPPASTTT